MAVAKLLKFVLSVYLCGLLNVCNCEFLQGYYWKDYMGLTPPDAFVGGTKLSGEPAYIGQILAQNKLIPTELKANNSIGFYGYLGKEHNGTENQKILCTDSPENLKWVSTRIYIMNHLTNKEIVVGGFEPGCSTYIGRTLYNSEVKMGKISVCGKDNLGLYITHNGDEINLTNFDVLTYDDPAN